MSKIIYEPHPVNAARKAKLQAEGYKILDAIFAPAGTPIHVKLEEAVEPVEPEAEAEVEVEVEAEDTPVAYEAEEEIKKAPVKRGRFKKG
jgi:hypothetical protein